MENSIEEQNISFDEQIEETEVEKRLSIPAKRLMEKLEPIPSKVEALQRRWFWELAQNASDFNDEVDVELVVNENTLAFSHNGAPFKLVDVDNLITPDSDKDDPEIDADYIGRFGSGFISTHVLSSVITVNGLVKDKHKTDVYYNFDFNLDRSNYKDKSLLIESIKESKREFKEQYRLASHNPKTFETKFTYDLSQGIAGIDSKGVAELGVSHLLKVLPYVLTFLPKLKSVKIKTKSFEYHLFQKSGIKETGTHIIGFSKNSKDKDDIIIRYAKCEQVTVAVEIKDQKVVEYPENIATLFLSLPMIGTENFPFPIVINSPDFVPVTERDSISLSENDTKNRDQLLNGIEAYKTLLQSLSNDGIGNLYQLVKIKGDKIKALTSGSEWFADEVSKKFRTVLEEVKFINCKGENISYSSLQIPFIPENKSESKDLDYYDTIYDLVANTVPKRLEYLHWLKNVDFSIFKTIPFRLEAAVKKVSEAQNLETLAKVLNKNEGDTTKWLANFIKYVLEKDNGLLKSYSIIPNKSQQGVFLDRDDDIYMDDEVDKDLILVYNQMKGESYNDKLLNDTICQEVSNLFPATRIKNRAVISKEIDEIFRLRLEQGTRLSPSENDGLKILVSWTTANGGLESKLVSDNFPTFQASYHNFVMDGLSAEDKIKALSIKNSGKQDSLLKLAESEITEEELNTVAESLSDVKQIISIIDSGANINQLQELAELFPDNIPQQVLDFAREEGEKKKDFNTKSKIGSDVEKLFKSAFEKEHLGFIVDKVDYSKVDFIYAGGGAYDFRITNPANKQSFYIEMKSVRNNNTDSVKLAISQLERAVDPKYKEHYCIALIERTKNITDMDETYVLNNLRFIQNPGSFLESVYEDHKKVIESTNRAKEAKLLMLNGDFRCSIDYEFLKTKSKSINELLEAIIISIKN